jgi:hypothetical protein
MIVAVPLAIWVARCKWSQELKRVDEEFASKMEVLEQSLAQEYAEMGLNEEGR